MIRYDKHPLSGPALDKINIQLQDVNTGYFFAPILIVLSINLFLASCVLDWLSNIIDQILNNVDHMLTKCWLNIDSLQCDDPRVKIDFLCIYFTQYLLDDLAKY